MNTFLDRLKAAIATDPTISAYNGERVIVVTEDDLTRDEGLVYSLETGTLFVLHTPRHQESHPEHEELGRDCSRFSVTVTAVQRSAVAIDETTREEVGLTGQPGFPGVVAMQTDLWKLLWNDGLLHLLPDAAGVPYLWDLEIGEAGEPIPIEEEDAVYTTSSRQVTGHRWRFYW